MCDKVTPFSPQKTPLAGCFFVVYSMGVEILAKLFGGHARVKIMRLFLLNDNLFEVEEVASRSRVAKTNVRREINTLANIGFIKHRSTHRAGSHLLRSSGGSLGGTTSVFRKLLAVILATFLPNFGSS